MKKTVHAWSLVLCAVLLNACAPSSEVYLEHPDEYGAVVSRKQTGPELQTYVVRMLNGSFRSIRTKNIIAMPGDCVYVGRGKFERAENIAEVCGSR